MDEGALKDYVGQPPFSSDRIYSSTPVGVVMGLAWCATPFFLGFLHQARLGGTFTCITQTRAQPVACASGLQFVRLHADLPFNICFEFVCGTGRTAMGGNSLYIEAACVDRAEGKAKLVATGPTLLTAAVCHVASLMKLPVEKAL